MIQVIWGKILKTFLTHIVNLNLMVEEVILSAEILSTNIANVMLRGVPDMVVVAAVKSVPTRAAEVLVKRLF